MEFMFPFGVDSMAFDVSGGCGLLAYAKPSTLTSLAELQASRMGFRLL
jgi:hypothetical protein